MAGDIYRFRKERERERENGKERKIRAERESDLLITQTDHKSSRVSTCGATFHAACSRAGTMQKAVAHTEARLTHPPSDVNSLGRYKVLPVLFATDGDKANARISIPRKSNSSHGSLSTRAR